MSESVSKIPKPQMRRLLYSQIKRNLIGAFVVTAAAALSWKYFVAEPRKKRYAEFYSTYDREAEFNRMRNKGLFQSCDPDE